MDRADSVTASQGSAPHWDLNNLMRSIYHTYCTTWQTYGQFGSGTKQPTEVAKVDAQIKKMLDLAYQQARQAAQKGLLTHTVKWTNSLYLVNQNSQACFNDLVKVAQTLLKEKNIVTAWKQDSNSEKTYDLRWEANNPWLNPKPVMKPLVVPPPNQFGASLWECTQSGKQANGLIKIDTKVFHIHTIVLYAACPHFQTLFDSGLQESSSKCIDLTQTCPDSALFEKVLKYIYTQQIALDPKNARELCEIAKLAHYLKLDSLVELCAREFEKEVTTSPECAGLILEMLHLVADIEHEGLRVLGKWYLSACPDWVKELGFDEDVPVSNLLKYVTVAKLFDCKSLKDFCCNEIEKRISADTLREICDYAHVNKDVLLKVLVGIKMQPGLSLQPEILVAHKKGQTHHQAWVSYKRLMLDADNVYGKVGEPSSTMPPTSTTSPMPSTLSSTATPANAASLPPATPPEKSDENV